jgi:NADH-quinone oxidoreductase subunit L
MKAMIVNRVSDYALTMGFAAIFKVFNTLDFDTFFSLLPYFADTTFTFYKTFTVNAYTMMATLLFLGAMGKSAQILLHT